MNEPRHVLVSTDGPVGTLTLNRPEVMNSFNFALLHALSDAIEAIEVNTGVILHRLQLNFGDEPTEIATPAPIAPRGT